MNTQSLCRVLPPELLTGSPVFPTKRSPQMLPINVDVCTEEEAFQARP